MVSMSALVSQLYSIKSGNIQSLVLVILFFFWSIFPMYNVKIHVVLQQQGADEFSPIEDSIYKITI